MGDVVTLVEKAQAAVEEDSARKIAEKMTLNQFTLDDFKQQLAQLKKMGSVESLVSMIPGMRSLKGLEVDESQFKVVESIIDSMTPAERCNPRIIDGSRRRRIARGSGRNVQDINRLLNQFAQMQKMIKQFGKKGKRMMGRMPGFPDMG